MNADADHVARRDDVQVERLERFVGNDGRAKCRRRRPGKDEQPAGRNHAHAEGEVAGVNEMNGHWPPTIYREPG
jgi:hypothetical protein